MDDLPHFDKIERKSTTEIVYDHLKEGILDGSLSPGTRLVEAQIADQMGISRSPVREALQFLEVDGLIDAQSQRGTFVKRLSAREVWEIYTARQVIEGYVAALAARRATPADVERLEAALQEVLRLAQEEDYAATVKADFEVHRLIWEVSGHQLLCDILSRLEVQIRMFISVQAPLFDHLYDSVEDHQDIIQAIAAGDAAAARETIEQHLLQAGRLAVGQLEGEMEEVDAVLT
jgi:DNA-binding GntR family transcriptional regulator